MRTSTDSARIPHPVEWRPWRDDLLAVIGRGDTVETEPAPWLTSRQARKVKALLEELQAYQALSSTAPGTGNAARARRRQGREIAARLTELLKFGVRVRWLSDGDSVVRLLCQRARH
jgi:hypothetical protein